MTLSVKIDRSALSRGLRLASSVAPRKGVMPIVSSVLLRANGTGTLKIAATDTQAVSLTADLPCIVTGQGSIALDAADLSRFVAGADGDEVTIAEVDGKRADVKIGRAKYRIAGMHDRDFPKVPVAPDGGVEVDAQVLHDVLSRVAYAVCLDTTRGALQGVMFDSDGDRCKFASSDGHRIVIIERKLSVPATKHVSICALGVAAIARLTDGAEKCRIAFVDKRLVTVESDGCSVSAALLDFPCTPYEQVVPDKHKASATVDRDRLIAALKRVAPLTSETRGVTIKSTQTGLALSTQDSDGEEMADEVECDVKGDIAFAMQSKYATEALAHMTGETCTLKFSGDLDPIVFTDHDDPGYTAVVMPMRM